jgi:hypothetical protein
MRQLKRKTKMPFVDTEHAILVVAKLLKCVDDSNPNVGIGTSYSNFVHQAIKILNIRDYVYLNSLTFDLGDDGIEKILKMWKED